MGERAGVTRAWTSEEEQRLRSLVASGKSSTESAEILGRTASAVQSRVHKIGAHARVLRATQERIRELAKDGWASSRISKRLGVPVETVDRYAGRTG